MEYFLEPPGQMTVASVMGTIPGPITKSATALNAPPLEILIVEDNPSDVELLKTAFREWRHRANLHVVADGEEALAWMFRKGAYTAAVQPDLILLDLNLPKRSGTDVLRTLKQTPELQHIPVVVLTTSDRSEDVSRAYQLHANCYLTKTIDMYEFFSKIRALEEFWFFAVRLPFDLRAGH